MKKALKALLTATVIFSLTACGNTDNSIQTTDNSSKTNENAPIETTVAIESDATTAVTEEANQFKTSDTVSVKFKDTTITIIYRGTPESYFCDSLEKGVYKYMKLYFTYEKELMDNAGVFQLETYGDGSITSLLQFGDYKLSGGEVTFGENGFPMTCVFTGAEDEISGIYSNIDMSGKIKVSDSLSNSYSIAYIKDTIIKS